MKTRVLTAIVAIIVLIAVLIAPPIVFDIAICGVILAMLYEFYSSAKASKSVMVSGFISAMAILASLAESVYKKAPITDNRFLPYAIFLTVLIHCGVTVLEHGKSDYKNVLSSGFFTLYITFAMGCLALTKSQYGTGFMVLIFICAWATDTGAYFTGKALGRHKLIPHVSPNKTVEGAVGGIVTAIVCCIIYLFIYVKFINGSSIQYSPWLVLAGVLIGGISGVFSQLGDLVASAIKRDTGVKDFGWIFPGHGGFMDRFDSVMFIAPLIYVLLQYMIK